MCDTQVFRGREGTWFAKNSDREPSEPQLVVRIPPVLDDRASTVKTTYLEIDESPHRRGMILSKPSWIWGAEMGANDRGVVIGNEAVFSKIAEKTPLLLGMDLVRLGLERGDTARHALDVVTSLLERYGQGGPAGFRDKSFCYDNSFILADADEAWILETAGRHWVAKRVTSGGAAISNCLTIGTDFDLSSRGVEDFARRRGFFDGQGEFDFARAFDRPRMVTLAGAAERLEASRAFLGSIDPSEGPTLESLIDHLRHHDGEAWDPAHGSNRDVCMHAAGPIRRSQTCGSMVSRLDRNAEGLHLFTGTSAPCLSIFKPVSFAPGERFSTVAPAGAPVKASLWARREPVHRYLLFDDEARRRVSAEAKATQLEILERLGSEMEDRDVAIRETDSLAANQEQVWIDEYGPRPIRYPLVSPYSWFWRRLNRLDAPDRNSGGKNLATGA